MAEVERISRQGLAEVREAITGYRSSGLAAEIEHVRETLTAAGIDTTIEARAVPLAPAQESALTLALREAATNVIRHAAATKCHIKFYAQDGSALMEVQDDGRGSDAPFGNGLSGMSERIQALGGVLRRETERGTRVADLVCRSGRRPDGDPSSHRRRSGMVLGALAALLEIESDIEVVARAHDGREALALAARDRSRRRADRHRDAADDGPRNGGRAPSHAQGPAAARHHPDDVRAARATCGARSMPARPGTC